VCRDYHAVRTCIMSLAVAKATDRACGCSCHFMVGVRLLDFEFLMRRASEFADLPPQLTWETDTMNNIMSGVYHFG